MWKMLHHNKIINIRSIKLDFTMSTVNMTEKKEGNNKRRLMTPLTQ